MTVWKSFGASVTGPKHIREGKPNQDSWAAFHHTWGDGVVASDGLGSKVLSEIGSDAVCRAVECAARTCHGLQSSENHMEDELTFLSDRIKSIWLSFIAPLEPRDCSATCMFAFRFADGIIRMGMLGDGLLAVLKSDGTVLSLSEDKTGSFSNVTSALSKNTTSKDWRFLTLQENLCRAVLLCTDGISDDLTDIDNFVRGFVAHSVALACTVAASRSARKMLEDWPTPKHSDDKTIACLFGEEVVDE